MKKTKILCFVLLIMIPLIQDQIENHKMINDGFINESYNESIRWYYNDPLLNEFYMEPWNPFSPNFIGGIG